MRQPRSTTPIYLGVGSNQAREKNIRSGLQALTELLGEIKLSPIYESKSVGFNGSNFFNLVIYAHTDLTLSELSEALKKIEDKHGRVRGGATYSPRSLDIDILTYGDCVGIYDGIELPRAEITENAFVLLPLSELAPQELHPRIRKTYAELWANYDQSAQSLWKIELA